MSDPAAGGSALTIRVYYEDTDFSGIVYHASYIRFMERGRTELLRAIGIGQREMAEGEGIAFAVRRIEIDYLRPARIDDLVTVETRVAHVAGARLVLDQAIRRGGDLLVKAAVTVAAIGRDGRARRLPDSLRAHLGAFAEPDG